MEMHGWSTRMHTFPSGCGDAQRSPVRLSPVAQPVGKVETDVIDPVLM